MGFSDYHTWLCRNGTDADICELVKSLNPVCVGHLLQILAAGDAVEIHKKLYEAIL